MEQHAPGRKILLVVGILYLIFGGIGILSALGGFAMVATDDWDTIWPVAVPWSVFYAIALIGSVFYLVLGLMGVINRQRLEKAGLLRILGIIAILYVVVEAILSFTIFAGPLGAVTAVFTLIFGLVLPILYLVGASKNLAAYQGQAPQ